MLKRLYYKILVRLFNNREASHYECPVCLWDTTNDDSMENATITSFTGTFQEWGCIAKWKCPKCGTKFNTWESN